MEVEVEVEVEGVSCVFWDGTLSDVKTEKVGFDIESIGDNFCDRGIDSYGLYLSLTVSLSLSLRRHIGSKPKYLTTTTTTRG